ncbi:MAG: protocatechuate 3,4-dioxygenase subunit alpha [Rhodobacteraceae bacterium]|nr:protocatechuate 3,4-dioxygenase subunit alpha [Paracoccaceae bacterium]
MTGHSSHIMETPSQTAGPYVQIGCTPSRVGLAGINPGKDLGASLVSRKTMGRRISITGQIFDGTGKAVRDGLVEIWQADHNGLFNTPLETRGKPDPHFTGWGRQGTDLKTGLYRFETIVPGRVSWHDGRMQAPHVTFWIAGRGINLGLCTRMYFPDHQEDNAADPVLTGLEHPTRIPTLIAAPDGDDAYRFDIVLRGRNETVFFEH